MVFIPDDLEEETVNSADDENLALTEDNNQVIEGDPLTEETTELPLPEDNLEDDQEDPEATIDNLMNEETAEGETGADDDSELDELLASIENSSEESGEILDNIESQAAGNDELLKEVSKLRLSERQQAADIEALNGLVSKLTKDVGDGRLQLAEKEVFGDVADPKLTVLMKYISDESESGQRKKAQILRDMYEETTGRSIDTELTNEEADIMSLAGGGAAAQPGGGITSPEDGPLIF